MNGQLKAFKEHIKVTRSDISAIELLSANYPKISKSILKKAMKFGAVWLENNGTINRLRRAKQILREEDVLHIYFNPEILFNDSIKATLVADELKYSVWNKPCGMLSQGTKWGDHTAICRWVELNEFADRQSFLVHRLDRATQGLIVIAHSKKVASALASQFESRQVEKHYKASVKGKFPKNLTLMDSPIDDKNAITRVLACDYDLEKDTSHLTLKIETGRKHQIRKHLSSQGFPVIGDRLYGDQEKKLEMPDLQLESCFLKFNCPVTGESKSYTL